jgi:UDP-glucose 4-epimerase
MKLLVTGGAGYIGSTVVAQLLEAGHDVTVLDNLSRGHADVIPKNVRFIKADIHDAKNVISAADGFEAVLHFAAYMAAGESAQKPELYWENNVVGSLRLIDAIRIAGIKKLIFSSTAAVYGEPASIPIDEDTPTKPTSTYGATKLAIDMAVTNECVAYGLAATSLRYFNVVGSYGSLGERHEPESHIIPIALEVAAGKRASFPLFGDDYPTEDGTCIRDYIHVADLARAHLLALDKLETSKHNIYNLANGNGFSNREVISAVEKVTGKNLNVEILARRSGDPAKLIATNDRAKLTLGWVPQKPALETMIQDAWKFYQQAELN